ncbi:MAG: glycosyltransferase family 2 protein [Methanocorpusculum sp.]|nr:glycosyltransferase family 2 protein [Methanocorpusculum sp.]MDE2521656.1 glycosyltransferase family 2 protein [Methanocorpusculum sp.]MDE2525243.1 glycosyltransferase family 2 protein [Methanocorpusculum sp.]
MTRTIVSVGWVKNEADVIESSVRYALTHSDKVIIAEDGSVDNTRTILLNLQTEFKDRVILPQPDGKPRHLLQDDATNALIQTAFTEYAADIVIPFDADEFVISPDGKNVRDILQNMADDQCYVSKWRHYLWYKVSENPTGFVPQRYCYFRKPGPGTAVTKVILCKKAWNTYNLSIRMGNHDVKSLDAAYASVPLQDLVFAHYPVRSKEQIATKAVRDGMGRASVDLRWMQGTGWHILDIYRNLRKQNFQISDEEMLGISLFYSEYPHKKRTLEQNMQKLAVVSDPDTLYPPIHCIYPPSPFVLFDTVVSLFGMLCEQYKTENPLFCMKMILAANDTISQDYRHHLIQALSKTERTHFKRGVLFFRLRPVLHPVMKIMGELLPPSVKKYLRNLIL